MNVVSRGPLQAAGILVGAVCLVSPFRVGVVCGHSMSPSLRTGEFYLLNRGYYHTHPVGRGDIVVFDHERVTYIKRVLAGPGDTVYVSKQLNSPDLLVKRWELPLLRRALQHRRFYGLRLVKRKVPAGYCYVVGDNLPDSVDSRDFGPIALDMVRGRV